jgi:hypothetical protein
MGRSNGVETAGAIGARRELVVVASFSRVKDVRFRRVGEETVVLRQQAAEVLVLSEVAGRILELVDGRSAEEIVAELEPEFDAERSILERDVADFLATLEARGIIERR